MRWLHARAPLQENALIRLPERDVAAIFAPSSGQQRANELFRRAQRMRVSRTVVATVAMQDDYMKRVRGGGGARDQLRAEGIVIFGDYAGDQVLASALGLPRPGPASLSAPGWFRAPAGARPAGTRPAGTGTMPVPSVLRAPTGCSARPLIRRHPRPCSLGGGGGGGGGGEAGQDWEEGGGGGAGGSSRLFPGPGGEGWRGSRPAAGPRLGSSAATG